MKKQIIYLNILRIFACFMVIINHTHGFILNYDNIINSTFYCLIFSLCKVGVPFFLMITGALLLDKAYDYKKVFKCIMRVFVPLFVISFCLYLKKVGFNEFNVLDFLKKFISSPFKIAYWYIYALMGLYLVIPFLQKLVKNFDNNDYVWYITLFLIIPSFIKILSIYLNIEIFDKVFFSFFPYITVFLICGNYLSKVSLSKKCVIISFIVFGLSYIMMFNSMYIPYVIDNKISYVLDSWNSFPVILMSISMFYIIRYFFELRIVSIKNEKIINTVASTTFGIYLIHTMVNWELYNLGFIKRIFVFNGILGIILLEFMVFVACFIIVYITKFIPLIKKYL